MVSVDEALKTIYKNDTFPQADQQADKDLTVVFSGLGLTVAADQFAEDKGEFELTESICTEDQLKFGKCNASSVKFALANVTDLIKGQEFSLAQKVNGSYDMPLGLFTVDTCPKEDDLIFKDVTAYDRMKKIETDVAAWYNGLTFPMTLAAFRASFLTYVGLTEDTSNLPLSNDSMAVEKTIDTPAQLSGRTVIEAIEELNGCFGHINRYGKFAHIILIPAYGLYPSNDLYPSDTLYPVSETDTAYTSDSDETIESYMYEKNDVKFEEYTVKEIDKLIIRQDENDVGAIVGTGSNAYVIQDNFLVYGKSAADLQTIANNAFGYIKKRPYRPYESNNIGLPYLEVGDKIEFATTDKVVSFVLSRTLKGIQALRDTFGASGSEEQTEQTSGTNYEIQQLKGKTEKITKTVEQVSVSVSNLDTKTSGEIDVLSNQIVCKVNADGKLALAELSADPSEGTTIKLSADNITLEGIITANGNFKILTDGSMESIKGKIAGWTIDTNTLTSPSSRMKLGGTGMNLYNSSGTYLGGIVSTSSTDGGVVIVKSPNSNYIALATTNDTNPDDGMSVSLNVLYTPTEVTLDNVTYESGFHFRLTDVYVDYGGIKATANIQGENLIANTEVQAPTGAFTNLYLNGAAFTPGNYYTKSESDAKYAAKSSYDVVIDLSTAKGKIYVVNGMIGQYI